MKNVMSIVAIGLAVASIILMLIVTVQYYMILWAAISPVIRAALIRKVMVITMFGGIAAGFAFLAYKIHNR